MKNLTVEEKLTLLYRVMHKIIKWKEDGSYVGLCLLTQAAVYECYHDLPFYSELPLILPELFSKEPENAPKKWFPYDHDGYKKRLSIINETIKELEEKLNNE